MRTRVVKTNSDWIKCTVSADVKANFNSPFTLRKIEKSKEIIAKAGFPAELLKLQAERLKK